jgi:hypothetical protein
MWVSKEKAEAQERSSKEKEDMIALLTAELNSRKETSRLEIERLRSENIDLHGRADTAVRALNSGLGRAELSENLRWGSELLSLVGEAVLRIEKLECERMALLGENAGLAKELHQVDQILGKALGYPEGYPEVNDTDDGSVVTGEHTVVSLSMEAEKKICDLRSALGIERAAAAESRPVIPTVTADEAAVVDKVKKAIKGKPDSAVQPTRAGTLNGLIHLIERMPRS